MIFLSNFYFVGEWYMVIIYIVLIIILVYLFLRCCSWLIIFCWTKRARPSVPIAGFCNESFNPSSSRSRLHPAEDRRREAEFELVRAKIRAQQTSSAHSSTEPSPSLSSEGEQLGRGQRVRKQTVPFQILDNKASKMRADANKRK